MNNSEIKEKLKNILPEKRYLHSIGVSETAEKLAKMHNVCPKKAYLAGLLHDCAKMQTDEELLKSCREFKINLTPDDMASMQVLHGFVGAEIAKRDFSVSDTEILDAIRYHTLGRENMSPLEKIIFIADITEPTRKNSEMFNDIRKASKVSLERAALMVYDSTIEYVKKRNLPVHPASLLGRQYLISEKEKANEKNS